MRIVAALRWLLLFAAPLPITAAPQEINPPRLPDTNRVIAIVGATLIDGTGAAPVSKSCVILRGNKIISVGTNCANLPAGARLPDRKPSRCAAVLVRPHRGPWELRRGVEVDPAVLTQRCKAVSTRGRYIGLRESQ